MTSSSDRYVAAMILGVGLLFVVMVGGLVLASLDMARRRCGLLVAVLVLWAASAGAQVTVRNYAIGSNTTAIPNYNQVYKVDVDGNKLDNLGQLNSFLQVGTYPNQQFYAYSSGQGCGVAFDSINSTPPTPVDCGVIVYRSKDFRTWYNRGLLYPIGSIGTICSPNQNRFCFPATMIGPRASDGHYLMWLQGADPGGAGFAVLDCGTTPGGATDGGTCTRLPDPTGNNASNGPWGTGQPWLDDDGIHGWLAYQNAGGSLVSTALTNNLTDFDPSSTAYMGSNSTESVSMFRGPDNPPGTPIFYGIYGSKCAFCQTGSNAYFSISGNPSGGGGWGTPNTQFDNSNSACQSQLGMVFRMKLAGGAYTWILNGAQWTNSANEGLAANFQVPLTFNTSTTSTNVINPFNCQETFTIAGLTQDTPPSPPANLDQASTNGWFWADQRSYIINNATSEMQTFTPTQATLSGVRIWVSQANSTCSFYPPSPCGSINGDLGLALVSLDGSLNPSAVLASVTVPVANVSWNSVAVPFSANVTVTPGTTYGIVVSCVGTCSNGGVYTMARDLVNPYSGGVARQCTGVACQTGPTYAGTWSTLDSGTTDYKFATYGPGGLPPPITGGSPSVPPAVFGGGRWRR